MIAKTYKRWFHTRSIIIMSEQKVRHLPINGHVQFVVLVALLGGVCWSTYSTDRFLTARAVVKEQKQTIRSVASDRVNMNFGSVLRPVVASSVASRRAPQTSISLSDPMLALSGPDPKALYAHIARLEQQVSALKTSNEAIIQHVKEKTASNIDVLENIIRKTGLNEDELKKIALKNEKKSRSPMEAAEGGPFIPAELGDLGDSEDARTLFSNLDELSTLRQIVGNLPLARPIQNASEQSGFGHRIDPFTRRLAFHSGLDLSGPDGSKALSTAAGKVVSAGRNNAYGNAVDIDHGYGIVTRYAHLSRILVNEGDIVAAGQPIGIQGSTGRSTGAHLHYEVRYHDKPLNPINFLSVRRYVSQN
jgi:murein DD-endopeptidase MepM/ murein hydrolase activator NlpD